MGRQFSYFCCPEDLAEIESVVFRPLGGSLASAEKRGGAHEIVPTSSFALAREHMGNETLFLYLLPPEEMRDLVFAGPWLDQSRSHVMEVGRSYLNAGQIGLARFWYETRFVQDGISVEKSKEFIEWSEAVFRRTKAVLARHSYPVGGRVYTEWFGKLAWREVQAGELSPA